MRIYKVLALLAVGVLFTSCATTWSHQSGNNSNLDTDKRYCGATANAVAPTYICRNPLMCDPDETNKVLDQLIGYEATFKTCMYKKGYDYQ